ncbi:hypothetical protein HU200_012948 [Digitaria exilis]|uniref:WRKY domain-containing protein n=1 Tax=Digitaria exilis TaxID=1010633 RepID=A0A835FE70_9POAL|nr:hypothetical protein HU200_012948 [Digitaria exilis]
MGEDGRRTGMKKRKERTEALDCDRSEAQKTPTLPVGTRHTTLSPAPGPTRPLLPGTPTQTATSFDHTPSHPSTTLPSKKHPQFSHVHIEPLCPTLSVSMQFNTLPAFAAAGALPRHYRPLLKRQPSHRATTPVRLSPPIIPVSPRLVDSNSIVLCLAALLHSMASSTGSLEHGGFTFTPPPFITSFTELLSGSGDMLGADHHHQERSPRGLFHRRGGVPKFKSAQPPSLPISPPPCRRPPTSPSRPGSAPPSCSTRRSSSTRPLTSSPPRPPRHPRAELIASQRAEESKAQGGFNDFSFHAASSNAMPTQTASFPSFNKEQQVETENKQSVVAATNKVSSGGGNNSNTKLEDGYNWRKYGQKQVKGSENPRSYYKCTYHSCSMKKKVERSLADGRITQIVLQGRAQPPQALSHPPQLLRRPRRRRTGACGPEHSGATPKLVRSPRDDEAENASQRSDGDEPDAKRCSGGAGGSGAGAEACGADAERHRILDDGVPWRKYGQKLLQAPRPGALRKHVERASHDTRAVITTYEASTTRPAPRSGSPSHRRAAMMQAPHTGALHAGDARRLRRRRLRGQGRAAGRPRRVAPARVHTIDHTFPAAGALSCTLAVSDGTHVRTRALYTHVLGLYYAGPGRTLRSPSSTHGNTWKVPPRPSGTDGMKAMARN